MKVYTVIFEYSMEDNAGVDVDIFSTYQKALEHFNYIVEREQDNSISWVGDAYDENGDLLDGFSLDCNTNSETTSEKELFWNFTDNNHYYTYDYLTLKIMEVK